MSELTLRRASSARSPAGFASYGELLRALTPSAWYVALVRGEPTPLWVSGADSEAALLAAARTALGGAGGQPFDVTAEQVAVCDDGRAINAFCIHDGAGGVLAVVTMARASFFSERPLADVLALIRPALDCLSRELNLRASLGTALPPASPGADLPMLLGVAEQERGLVCNGFELGRLVDAALRGLGTLIATLIVPDKNIAIVRRRAGSTVRGASTLVTRSHRQLMSWAVQQGRPLVVNDLTTSPRLPPCRILSVRVRAASGRVVGFLAFLNDAEDPLFTAEHVALAEVLAANIETILQHNYDSLTGLATRAAFERDAEIMIARAPAGPCSVIYMDIDGMALINERFSLPVGDAVISEVAGVIQRHAPRSALAARLAGDRYALLLPGAAAEEARSVARSLATAITEVTAVSGELALKVSVSVGVARVDGASAQPLAHALAAAEQASKLAKRAHLNDVPGAGASPAGDGAHGEEMSVATLRKWLEADRFELYAQPMLALSDATPEPRFEILLRGLSPLGEALTPGKLITAAESHGLMPAIDAWVIDKAFAMLAPQNALLRTRSARFSINLSHQALVQDTIPNLIEAAWRRSGVPADLMCFEIAEAAVLAAPERATEVMRRLRSLGFQIALDDAGSEHLTAAQIAALPVDVLKLEAALVRRAAKDAWCASLLSAMIDQAHAQRRITVANGVESDDQRRLLSGIGADYGQGFAIGRPAPLSGVLRDVAMYAQIDSSAGSPVTEGLDAERA